MTMRRPIHAMAIDGIVPATPPTPPPECTWLSPSDLLVDGAYQRTLSERSITLIRRIVATWDWRRFKPPVAAWTEEGLEVIDGQHTAIAAMSHPAIEKIPVMVVEAPDLVDRAQAFLGHNRDRLNVTRTQIHAASLAAKDEDALGIERVCAAVGIAIVRTQPKAFKPGETMAIAAIERLIRNHGEEGAKWVLDVLRAAECAPVSAQQIRAVELLMTDEEYCEAFDAADLTAAIVQLGDEAEKEAKVFAATHCVPLWRGLASVWFKKTKKRKKAAAPPHSRGGWSPGVHLHRCNACDNTFVGARLATTCSACAYQEDAA
ncbi:MULTISPECIES: DUF6551 family protein [unclassified Chelatococcus]|uniref:DUF6551 family protein n=1 Tax=unclassified Chelatococcus TaxID=2638111 RepID=UPI001BCA6FD3|nr:MULTISPECIES: DUF6551 family protein [unclassified Chelatococcus]MBS7696247.1 hypothetical protein [Chelatococcus sp. YT9]MBX3560075.1 hypothetical protein [Chelatococcus sp.]